ncbi:MAG TPA: UDP-glucose 4-epimerase GalE [Myxococcota bacterium]|nr:UDP-glucose 4-epimerase GalE [Myxococcota bacterium]
MSHLLVTGGAGYIGSHALRALRRAGHSALVVDDLRAGREFLVGDAPLVRCDVADRDALARAFASHGPFDGVLHFAASLCVSESVSQPLDYYANNVGGSLALIRVAIEHGTRAFVLSSSCATYGVPARVPISESAPLAPISPYGASKAMVERVLADAAAAHGLRWAALRYFNAAGADPDGGIGECHEPEIHLIPSALEAACGLRERLELFGTDYPTRDGTCVRDYIHVTDLADAHVRAIEALIEGRSLGARNLGTGKGHTNREVLAAVERAVGRPVPLHEADPRPGDPPELVADASRFCRELGWEPRLSDLESIVSTAWSWLRHWKLGGAR